MLHFVDFVIFVNFFYVVTIFLQKITMQAQNRFWRCAACGLFNVAEDIHCHRCSNRRVDCTTTWVDVIRKTRLTAEYNGNRKCPFCWTDVEVGERVASLDCGLLHHYKCLKTWINGMGHSCSICRALVPVDTVLVVAINEDNN